MGCVKVDTPFGLEKYRDGALLDKISDTICFWIR